MKLDQCLGTIEVVGMPAAIEAADTAVKAAEVTLVGTELTDGQGMVSVKVLGEVSAVTAALAAAKTAAGKVNKVVAVSVIPRPDPQLESIVLTPATIGYGTTADTIATGDSSTLASAAVYAGDAKAAELPTWTGGALPDAARPVLTPDVHDAASPALVAAEAPVAPVEKTSPAPASPTPASPGPKTPAKSRPSGAGRRKAGE